MSLEEKVISIISKNIEKKLTVSLEKELISDLGVDSVSMLMITYAMEDEFGITIDDEDFKDIVTVKDIVAKLRLRYPAVESSK